MASQFPVLDINLLDTHSLQSIAVLDTSIYPPNWTNTSPTLQVTIPGHDVKSLAFTPSSIQIYKSTTLGVVCEWCDEVDLPDGIWKFKYSVYPATKYYVEKSFVRIDKLQSKFDEAYVTLDLSCDGKMKKEDRVYLSSIENYMEGAVAAGNKCIYKLFDTYYKKASFMLGQFINHQLCAT